MTQYDIPAWAPVIDALRERGIPTIIETSIPGCWYLVVPSEDPAELVMIGSHRADSDYKHEATIDIHAGPLDVYVVYRQVTRGDGIPWVTEDVYTVSADVDELAAAIRTVKTAPLKEL